MANHRLGLIGAGAFTAFSLEAYQKHLPELVLAGITDPEPSRAQALANQFQIAQVYSTTAELLADQTIDVVAILTPPNTHFALAMEALSAGKHLLVEKPIAFNVSDAQQLLATADANNAQLTANLVLRFHPFHQELAKIQQEGKFGALQQINTSAQLAEYPPDHWYWNPAISGGFFLNTFCHFLDLYGYIWGQFAKDWHSVGNDKQGFTLIGQFADHSHAALTANLHATNGQEQVRSIYMFEQAVVETNGWFPNEMITTPRHGNVERQLFDDKLAGYHKALADVMADLLSRIEQPGHSSVITHQDLLQAVASPTRAAENCLQ